MCAWACSGEVDFISVLAAVEAAAGCAGDRCAVSLDRRSAHCWWAGYGSQAGETETGGSRWHFKLKSSASN
jgi:hypothetical protein